MPHIAPLRPFLALLLALSGCTPDAPPALLPPGAPLGVAPLLRDCLAEGSGFSPRVQAELAQFVAELPRTGPGHPAPLALFDWDNTLIKNDIGAAVTATLVRQGLVHRPPSWERVPYLTAAARAHLERVCAGGGPRLPADPPCADALISLYQHGTLPDGSAGFSGYDRRTYKPTAAWQSMLLAGHTPDQARRLTRGVVRRFCAAPVGSTLQVGTVTVPGYLRVYRPMLRLVRALQARGAEVWVVSASPQPVVDAFAGLLGLPRQRVIGIRALPDQQGRLTRDFAGCGAVRDGDNTLITYVEGKRCWVRQEIGRPALFGAGDSETDEAFLRDVTGLRLVIDRGHPELLCPAARGEGPGRWLVQPMFVEPQPPRRGPLPCPEAGRALSHNP